MSAAPADLLAALTAAAAGLTFGSEADEPFAAVLLPGAGEGWPYDAAVLAARLGLPPGTPAETRAAEDLLARHTDTSDPHDAAAQRLRPRYEAMLSLLHASLRDLRAIRLGRVRVRCWIVGADGRGNLAGYVTTAVET